LWNGKYIELDKEYIYQYYINIFFRYIKELSEEINLTMDNQNNMKKFTTIKPTDYTKITKDIIDINNNIQVKNEIDIIDNLKDIDNNIITKIKELFYSLDTEELTED
jgi:hypothetical protein